MDLPGAPPNIAPTQLSPPVLSHTSPGFLCPQGRKKRKAKKIEKRLKSCGVSSILTIDEVSEGNHNYAEVLESMIGNKVEKLDDLYIMDKDIYENAKNILINYIKENKEITLGEYRDLIDSSRKNCMIILENFDRNKITKRVENKRILF